jgi:hypothetical protein
MCRSACALLQKYERKVLGMLAVQKKAVLKFYYIARVVYSWIQMD